MDLIASSLGITRQSDGLNYRDVDFQANLNLLREAEAAGVGGFAYVHVLNADAMAGVPLVDAKTAFVDALRASDMPATVIAPTGYFSDMGDIFAMAQDGRATLSVLPILPRRLGGPARFFLTALGMDIVAPRFGTRRLTDHFATLAAEAAHNPSGEQK